MKKPADTAARRTRIKFCGITRAADADAAVALGIDALGFVLVPGSKRCVSPEQAAKIRGRLPAFVSAVALLMDADAALVQQAIDVLRPELLQFHGREDAAFCESFGLPYIKAVPMSGKAALLQAARRHRHAAALLIDSHGDGMGGTGKTFDWSKVGAAGKPLILAGGLTPANVGQALKQLRPFAVDVSTGIEARPGIKDLSKMRAFVEAVRRADVKRQ